MTTEQQARDLWCPMVRSAAPVSKTEMGPAVNRIHLKDTGEDISPDELQPYSTCIAGRCAMWRWRGTTVYGSHGYCGLAGKPEVIA